MKKLTKFFTLVVVLLLFITGASVDATSGYTYSHKNRPIYSTVGLDYSQVLTFDRLGIPMDSFSSPEDLFIYEDIVYIVDSKSNALFVFNTKFELQETIKGFEIRADDFTEAEVSKIKTNVNNESKVVSFAELQENGTVQLKLNEVTGVYRSKNKIYLADKRNNQIVIVDSQDYHVLQVVSVPQDRIFEGKTFRPNKLVTDNKDRMYIIADEIYEGIIELSPKGEFNRFTGVNKVTLSLWEIFWLSISTEAQRSKKASIISTTFTSLDIDDRGFIYATSRATTDANNVVTNDNAMIKKINPSADDILRRNGYSAPKGDIEYIKTGIDMTVRGPSILTSVAVNDYGVYTVADGKNGRLFTYDMEGNLLYISGGKGQQLNLLQQPVSIKYLGEDLVVLDRVKKSVIIYKPTQIAQIINQASKYFYEGKLEQSSLEWEKVVELNSNYEYAYVGIGKNLLDKGEYIQAMENFKIGFNRTYYSKAYKMYRDELVKEYFAPVVTVIIVAIVSTTVIKKIKRRKKPAEIETGIGDE